MNTLPNGFSQAARQEPELPSCGELSALSWGTWEGKLFYWRASEGLPGMWGGLPAGPAWGGALRLCPTGCYAHQQGGAAVRHLFYTWYARTQCTPLGWDGGVEGCKGRIPRQLACRLLGGALLRKWFNMRHLSLLFHLSTSTAQFKIQNSPGIAKDSIFNQECETYIAISLLTNTYSQ